MTLSAAVSAVALEGALRLYERHLRARPAPGVQRLGILEPAPGGSYRLRPDLDLTRTVPGYDVRITTNRHGMHWGEVEVEAAPGLERVAFVGDSFTFGCWVPRVDEAFVGVFADRLRGERIEALNFGVVGYGLRHEEKQLREEVLRFGPRYVVVVVFNGNDFRDTWLGIDKDRIVDGVTVPNAAVLRARVPSRFRGVFWPGATPSPEGQPWRALGELATFRLAAPLLRLENLSVEFVPSWDFMAHAFWSRVPPPPVALAARDATVEALVSMERLAAARGARLAVVTLPTQDQVYARLTRGPGFDLDLPQAWIREAARERGIPFLDAMPLLRERARRTNERLFVPGDTHLNVAGHRLVGEAIADWFRCCVRR